jgi:hypothetical protein
MVNQKEIDKELYREITVEDENVGSTMMDDPFNPSLIDIDTKSPTLSLLMTRLSSDPPEIDLYPDFQRSDDLWDSEKQSRLIESILISFPLPAFYFDATDDNSWLVVDGLQRLSSLRNFIINKSLRLSGLEFLHNLEGSNYDDLSRTLQRKIDETQIVAYLIKPGTPIKVKYNIFKRINTGGLVLQPQEIRHALNQGIPARFVAELAMLEDFKKATEYKIDSSRMLDREFVTRFVAFYINEPESYSPDLDSFLNDSMAKLSSFQERERIDLKDNFTKAMKASYQIFGNWAFRKADLYPDRRKPINKALFEIWSVSLAKLSDQERKTIIDNKKEVIRKFVSLLKEYGPFWGSITSGTGDRQRVIYRFKRIREFLQEIINDQEN